MVVVDMAAERRHCLQMGFLTDTRLAIPQEVDTSEVTHMAIPIHEMPAVTAYSASRASRGHMVDSSREG